VEAKDLQAVKTTVQAVVAEQAVLEETGLTVQEEAALEVLVFVLK